MGSPKIKALQLFTLPELSRCTEYGVEFIKTEPSLWSWAFPRKGRNALRRAWET
jgi:hypothetical protein